MAMTPAAQMPADRHPRLDIRAPVMLGVAAIVLFFGLGVGSAAIAPIDKGVGLPGTIIVESKVKQVAHQRGGIVGQIHVIEGQRVNAGELLITLDRDAIEDQRRELGVQLAAANRQLDLARQEASTITALQDRQLASKSRALALDRLVAEIEKDVSSIKGRLAAAVREFTQSEVRAPVAGRVMSLQVHATGAVIQPGQTVAEIVPDSDRLVVEGRLAPNQIENAQPGMPARVWVSAQTWREQRALKGKLAWVSADSVEDKRTGQSYFVARIEIQDTPEDLAKRAALHPGMRAEILLLTGQRTLLDQLVDPLMRNIHRAFHG